MLNKLSAFNFTLRKLPSPSLFLLPKSFCIVRGHIFLYYLMNLYCCQPRYMHLYPIFPFRKKPPSPANPNPPFSSFINAASAICDNMFLCFVSSAISERHLLICCAWFESATISFDFCCCHSRRLHHTSQHLCDFTRTRMGQRRKTHLRAQILAAVSFRPSYQLHRASHCRWVHRRSTSLFRLLGLRIPINSEQIIPNLCSILMFDNCQNPGTVAPATNSRLPPLKPEPVDYNYGFGLIDMKKKEKELQSKEAELRRMEQELKRKEEAVARAQCIRVKIRFLVIIYFITGVLGANRIFLA
ncbi:hypothetical protein HN51_008433 [Arachis hypogaea]